MLTSEGQGRLLVLSIKCLLCAVPCWPSHCTVSNEENKISWNLQTAPSLQPPPQELETTDRESSGHWELQATKGSPECRLVPVWSSLPCSKSVLAFRARLLSPFAIRAPRNLRCIPPWSKSLQLASLWVAKLAWE